MGGVDGREERGVRGREAGMRKAGREDGGEREGRESGREELGEKGVGRERGKREEWWCAEWVPWAELVVCVAWVL